MLVSIKHVSTLQEQSIKPIVVHGYHIVMLIQPLKRNVRVWEIVIITILVHLVLQYAVLGHHYVQWMQQMMDVLKRHVIILILLNSVILIVLDGYQLVQWIYKVLDVKCVHVLIMRII